MSARVLTLFLTPLMIGVPVSMWAQQAVPAQASFDSAEAAAQALIDAASKNDTDQLTNIFGPNAMQILTSGDPAKDQAERQEFSQLVQRKHKLEKSTLNMNVMILTVGDQGWPFPVPIVRTSGKWRFDTTEGKTEMRARRIGANELDAIEICSGYVEAQKTYAARVRDEHGMLEYAQQIMGSAGKNDALYWKGKLSLVPEGFAQAEVSGTGSKPKPYHGYYFRILKSQGPDAPGGQHTYISKDSLIGGFGLVAWPAEHGVTGIHTFIVNQDGMVYERDLGAPASALAAPVSRYNPDKSWVPVD